MAEPIGLEAFIKMDAFRAAAREYNKSIDDMNTRTDKAASGISGRFQKLGGTILGVAKGLGQAMVAGATAATGALVGFVANGVRLATDLEDQMAGVRAILGVTADDLEIIRQKTVELGLNPNLKVSAVEAAGAIEMLARNGLSMNEILEGGAESTILLANATGSEFSNAANIATDAMAIFNIEAKDMIQAVDGITSVTTSSKFDVNDYALALAQGGGAASSAGVEFNDFNTAIAAISPLFKSGSDAGTSFKTLLTRLTPTTNKASDLMRELGIVTEEGNNQFFDAQGNLRDMAGIAGVLDDALSGLTEEQRTQALTTLFGADAMRAAVGLMNTGKDGFLELQEAMGETSAIEQAKIRVDTLAGALDIMSGIFEAISLQVGDLFIPIVRQAVEAISSFVEANQDKIVAFFGGISSFIQTFVSTLQAGQGPIDAFLSALSAAGVSQEVITFIDNLVQRIGDLIAQVVAFVTDHSEAFRGALIAIGAVLAGAAIAAGITAIVGALTAFATGIGPIILLVGLLGAVVAENWDVIQAAILNAWAQVKPVIDQIVALFTELWTQLQPTIGAFQGFAQQIISAFQEGGVQGAIEAFRGLWPEIQTAVLTAVQTIVDFIGQKIGIDLLGIITGFVQAFQTAGWRGAFDEFMNYWPGIQEAAQTAITNLVTFVGEQIGVDLLTPFNKARSSIATTMGKIRSTVANVIAWWNSAWPPVQTVFSQVWTFISALVTSVIATLQPTIQNMVTNIQSAFSSFAPVGQSFSNLWQTLAPIVSNVAQIIGGVLLGLFGVVVGVFNGIIAAINPLITTLGFVLNGVINFVNGVIQFFTGLYDILVGLFTLNKEQMLEGWESLKAGVTNIVLGLYEAVLGFFMGLGATLWALVKGIVDGVIQFFTNLYNTLVGQSIIPDMVNAIVGWITGLRDQFINLVVGLVTSVLERFENLRATAIAKFQALKTAVQTKIQELKTNAIAKFQALKTAVQTKIEELKTSAIDKFNALKTTAVTKFIQLKVAVANKVEELKTSVITKALAIKTGILTKFEEMKTALSEKLSAFKAIGSNLIQSIKDGVLEKIGDLVAAVVQAAQDALNAAQTALGIGSPSKPFLGFGKNIMESLALGVRQMQSTAMRAVQDAVGGLPDVTVGLNARQLLTGSSSLFSPGPSTVSLDPSAIRALGSGGDTVYNYNLNNRSSETSLSIRDAFRILELTG